MLLSTGEWAQRGAGRGPGHMGGFPEPAEPRDQNSPSYTIGVPWKGREMIGELSHSSQRRPRFPHMCSHAGVKGVEVSVFLSPKWAKEYHFYHCRMASALQA